MRSPLTPRRAAALLVAAAVVLLAGCGSSDHDGAGDGGRIDVVATTTQLGDVARAVGGEAADVHQILQPNTDPHEYEPRPDDVVATSKADVILTSGDNLDGWMAKVADEAGSDATTLDVGADVPVRRAGETSGPEASEYDPHWWHDPVNVEAAASEIARALGRADPADGATFRRNAAAYVVRLKRLDAGIRRCMDAVPARERKLVTDHDAFGYFAGRYGIEVVGAVIPSQTTQAQPSAGDVADLARVIEREDVRAVFPETSVNKKLADAIARETGAASGYVLYGDTLGPAGSDGATYLTMEAHNADQMVRGFTGGRRGCTIAGL